MSGPPIPLWIRACFYLEGLVRGPDFGLSLHLHTLCVQAAVLARLCMCADSNSTEASLLGDSISAKISYADSIIFLIFQLYVQRTLAVRNNQHDQY